jgi:hypothetical protein
MRTFLRIMFVVVVAALIIGAGLAIFNAGMAQGAAMSGETTVAAPATFYPMFPPWGFWGFGCFALFGLFLLFPLLFGFGRMLFGPRRDWHHRPWGWRDPHGFNGDQVPPFVEDLHRKMHEKMNQPQA